jgi:hypothetical protein
MKVLSGVLPQAKKEDFPKLHRPKVTTSDPVPKRKWIFFRYF